MIQCNVEKIQGLNLGMLKQRIQGRQSLISINENEVTVLSFKHFFYPKGMPGGGEGLIEQEAC